MCKDAFPPKLRRRNCRHLVKLLFLKPNIFERAQFLHCSKGAGTCQKLFFNYLLC